ncbi:MAG: protein-methionine-sulfoxide reductase catalytic subunit MsrP [Pseudomonadota bacterium]
MLIRLSSANNPLSSDITPERVFLSRRDVLVAGAALASLGMLPDSVAAAAPGLVSAAADDPRVPAWLRKQVASRVATTYAVPGESLTPFADVSSYNNFYEFGTAKSDPAENARNFIVQPWRVRIDGEVGKPGDYLLEDLLRGQVMEERIYRFRCVEAWSMVVPWTGFPLAALLKRVAPTSRAKYVVFETLQDPEKMPGQKRADLIRWPYVEGLRIDEAMNPLTLLSVGLYGRTLPPQNGAPLRLIVPWKYGFKSIKSIVRIRFVERQPRTTWSDLAPDEYGFFANVNPGVDHPRWSQKRERRLPNSLFSPNWVETQMFNGYADQVASMYRGLDLRRFF